MGIKGYLVWWGKFAVVALIFFSLPLLFGLAFLAICLVYEHLKGEQKAKTEEKNGRP